MRLALTMMQVSLVITLWSAWDHTLGLLLPEYGRGFP